MVSSLFVSVMLLLIGAFMMVNGDDYFSQRYNQQYQPLLQRPLNSDFRQRGNSYAGVSRVGVSPPQVHNMPDRDLPPTTQANSPSSYDDRASGSINPISIVVAPLAALALLGVAATMATSPILLPITVLPSGRKRRDVERLAGRDSMSHQLETKMKEIETLEKFIANVPGQDEQQEKLMATYLSCSGFTESNNPCLDRVVCEYSLASGKMSTLEKDVISIILYNIMSNDYVPHDFKERLRAAARFGRDHRHCSAFSCRQLDH